MTDGWTTVGKRGKPKRASREPSDSELGAENAESVAERKEREVLSVARDVASPTGLCHRLPRTSSSVALTLPKEQQRRERHPERRLRDLKGHVHLAIEEILKSQLWRELQCRMQQAEEDALEADPASGCFSWKEVEEVTVLGLGSLEASPTPRYQLALALLLAEDFNKAAGRALRVRDPVFTEIDKHVLNDLGCQVLESDEEVFGKIQAPTLFFLPHCPASLTHNLLAANWDARALPKLFILGNSFEAVAERWRDLPKKQRASRPEPAAILKLLNGKAVIDVPVNERDFPVREAFNDMSVMVFPAAGFDFASARIQSYDIEQLARDG